MKTRGISVVEVSGEHPNLPVADALGSLQGMAVDPGEVWYEPRFLAFQADADLNVLASRLAFGRFLGKALLRGTPQEVENEIGKLDLRGKRFRLRVAKREGSAERLERSLGGLLTTGRVDLETPEVDLRLVGGSRAYLYQVSARIDRTAFETRAGRRRPFALPVTLHPRLARALVNLTGVAPGETLLDPFCGTGGILMEACLLGARSVGSDVREDVIEGGRENLAFFGMEADLHVSDVGRVREIVDRVDVIATDPPYGRGATTQGEEPSALLERSFSTFRHLLPSGGRLAISLPNPDFIKLGRGHFTLLQWHRVHVHRSLDRYFCLFRKP